MRLCGGLWFLCGCEAQIGPPLNSQPSALPSPSSYYITCHCLQNLCVCLNKSLFVLRSLGQTVDAALEILRGRITSNVHIQREKQLLSSKPKGHFIIIIISGQPHKSHFTMKVAIFRLQRRFELYSAGSPHHTLTAQLLFRHKCKRPAHTKLQIICFRSVSKLTFFHISSCLPTVVIKEGATKGSYRLVQGWKTKQGHGYNRMYFSSCFKHMQCVASHTGCDECSVSTPRLL